MRGDLGFIALCVAFTLAAAACAERSQDADEGGARPDAGVSVPPTTPFAEPPRLVNYDSATAVLAAAAATAETPGGRLVVWVQVDTAGRTQEVRIPRSGLRPAVERAVTDVARDLRFEPARSASGAPVPVWVQLPVEIGPGSPPSVTLDTAAWLIPRFKPLATPPRTENPTRAESLFHAIVGPALGPGVGGTVVVDLFVDETGRVGAAQTAQSSGNAELDASVKRWVRAVRFTPPIDTAGRPTDAWVSLPIRIGGGSP